MAASDTFDPEDMKQQMMEELRIMMRRENEEFFLEKIQELLDKHEREKQMMYIDFEKRLLKVQKENTERIEKEREDHRIQIELLVQRHAQELRQVRDEKKKQIEEYEEKLSKTDRPLKDVVWRKFKGSGYICDLYKISGYKINCLAV